MKYVVQDFHIISPQLETFGHEDEPDRDADEVVEIDRRSKRCEVISHICIQK